MAGAGEGTQYDVAISGYGPVGATLAALLGRSGLKVGVFERAAGIFAQPRAVGFDHDAMRWNRRIGIAQALEPHVEPFRDSVYVGADGQVIQQVRHMSPPYPLTWAPNYTCDQPGLEAVLRRAVDGMENVEVALRHEVVSARDSAGGVEFEVRDAAGVQRTRRAAFLAACDGASSPRRRALGLSLESMDYDVPWIVVDLQVDDAALARLPATNVQYCEPVRPCTYIVCPGNHRRWEFMVLEGEPTEGALDETRLWRLLARWIAPGQARIWRAAAYRFHALVARTWRSGRIFLAGDAAHQTPPFLGQGMCQGLRDAGNLAWKLELAVRGAAADGLLDTYTEERRPHVDATTRLAREFGRIVSERDPARARARDTQLLARGGGKAPTLIRQDLIPPLSGGLIAPLAPLAGTVFPQPRVRTGTGGECLLDDLGPPGFRLIVDPACDVPALHALAAAHGLHVIVVGGGPAGAHRDGNAIRVEECDSLVQGCLEAAGCHGALVRPDHYVYGGFSDADAAARLVDALMARAFALPRARRTPSPASIEPITEFSPRREPRMKPTILSTACTLIAATGAAFALAATPANAQDYPSKPIRLIVPVPPGVGPDIDSRFVAARIAGVLGQPMVIENRPGAATRIAIDAAVKSAPDGYTLLLGTPSMTTAPSLYTNLPFDAKRDLVPVSLLSVTPYALTVNAAMPAKTVKDFVALTKSDPSFSNVATLGLGTIPHLTGAWFAAISGAQPSFVHYNTSPPFNDLSAGRASAIFDGLLPVLGNIKSGKLRVLAVSGKQRNAMLPDVPTFAEAGFSEFDPMVWVGILAPAGTPPAIVKRLSAAFAEVARMPEIVEHRAKVGSDSIGSTPEEFAAFLDAERAKWGGVIKSLGIKLQ